MCSDGWNREIKRLSPSVTYIICCGSASVVCKTSPKVDKKPEKGYPVAYENGILGIS
jgi:hypothetical protein